MKVIYYLSLSLTCIILRSLVSHLKWEAVASSKAFHHQALHDVFVSFRGEDTRNNFVDHLFGALRSSGIIAFRDNMYVEKGEPIWDELVQAIEGSRVFIVIFSKNYASSTWCLRELAKILDWIKEPTAKNVLPVFYDVSPSEVRKQSGDYGKALAEHEQRPQQDSEEVRKWRQALAQVANLSGWDVQDKRQYSVIEEIVRKVLSLSCYNLSCLDGLVGMHDPIEQLERLLNLKSDGVQVVSVLGMSGIGKTTLVSTVYRRNYNKYGACCFIEDVSKLHHDHGDTGVLRNVISQCLKEKSGEIYNVFDAIHNIEIRLRRSKCFIVLDNVDKFTSLEIFASKLKYLGAGSKIIIVSTDKHVLEQLEVAEFYQVQELNPYNVHQLFCMNAFKKWDLIIGEYEELTNRALRYTKGHPLATKVLGKFLLGRNISEWKSTLDRLRDEPNKEIMKVLRISFDALEDDEKEIFLDIACFFDNKRESHLIRILDSCGFHYVIGISCLVDKSLINKEDGWIWMHNMLRELGKKIVRENAPNNPRKWSRLWDKKHFESVMFEQTDMEVNAVRLSSRRFDKRFPLRVEAISKMKHLRLLILDDRDLKFVGSLNLPKELRYLEWSYYPFMCLPYDFEPYNLVELILPSNNIEILFREKQFFPSLRKIDLRSSYNLINIQHFENTPNLEELHLQRCTKLVEIHPSIGILRKLVKLKLKDCTSLNSLPYSIFGIASLQELNLYGCSKAVNKQLFMQIKEAKHLKKDDTSETYMSPQSTCSILSIFSFHLFPCAMKETVGLFGYSCLRDLNLGF